MKLFDTVRTWITGEYPIKDMGYGSGSREALFDKIRAESIRIWSEIFAPINALYLELFPEEVTPLDASKASFSEVSSVVTKIITKVREDALATESKLTQEVAELENRVRDLEALVKPVVAVKKSRRSKEN